MNNMQKTQLNFIKDHILKYGYISRNFCLRNWITRLGARIKDLEKQGFKFNAGFEGKDYVYRLVGGSDKFGQKQPTTSDNSKKPTQGSFLNISSTY